MKKIKELSLGNDSYSSDATIAVGCNTDIQPNQQKHSVRIDWLYENDNEEYCMLFYYLNYVLKCFILTQLILKLLCICTFF